MAPAGINCSSRLEPSPPAIPQQLSEGRKVERVKLRTLLIDGNDTSDAIPVAFGVRQYAARGSGCLSDNAAGPSAAALALAGPAISPPRTAPWQLRL